MGFVILVFLGCILCGFALVSVFCGRTVNVIELLFIGMALDPFRRDPLEHDSSWAREVRQYDYQEGVILSKTTQPVGFWVHVVCTLLLGVAALVWALATIA